MQQHSVRISLGTDRKTGAEVQGQHFGFSISFQTLEELDPGLRRDDGFFDGMTASCPQRRSSLHVVLDSTQDACLGSSLLLMPCPYGLTPYALLCQT